MGNQHTPVLLQEAVSQLAPAAGGIYVDGNLGFGGHTELILRLSAPTGIVVGFDWDPAALEHAQKSLASFGDRIHFVRKNFAEISTVLKTMGITSVNGILLDLGLSSFQLEAGGRGFSFSGDEPLDMRMDPEGKVTAAQLVNTLSQEELADILFYYGEERQARRIASFLVAERERRPFVTARQLAAAIEKAVPRPFHPKKIHVATRSFQALRISVNHEMENLSRVLQDGAGLLSPTGRFCVISFHSLEDRMVKNAFKNDSSLQVVTKKPITASRDEIAANPRSRSAKLRVAAKKVDHGA